MNETQLDDKILDLVKTATLDDGTTTLEQTFVTLDFWPVSDPVSGIEYILGYPSCLISPTLGTDFLVPDVSQRSYETTTGYAVYTYVRVPDTSGMGYIRAKHGDPNDPNLVSSDEIHDALHRALAGASFIIPGFPRVVVRLVTDVPLVWVDGVLIRRLDVDAVSAWTG